MRVMFIVNDLGVNEPFGPMVLSAILKAKGHHTTLGVLQKEAVEAKIQSWKPDLLAYSMMSVDMPDMKRFNDSLRKRVKIFTILGGAHPTLDISCADDPNVDAICVGEGDDAISDVVDALSAGKGLDGIPNILVSGGSPLKLRGLVEDFDAYPFMDRELIYSYPEMARFGIKGIWASRGCAFPCPYCFNNRQNEIFKEKGKVVRRRSVDSVIKETIKLKESYRASFIRIQDDVFVHRADDWLKEFARRWSTEVRLPFYCLLRAELVSDEMALYLKKAGCFSICMSIESGDDDVRKRMMRRNVSKEQLERAFAILKRHKINVYANSMLALPFTTLEQDISSVDIAVKVQPELPNFSIFMPYPGTDLGDYCRSVGIYDPDKDYITYGVRNMSPLSCFSGREKEIQYNLCQLAIIAIKFPWLRSLIIDRLIYWRPNNLFFLLHYAMAVSTYGRKIFYFKHTLAEYAELIVRTFKHYLYDYKKEAKVEKDGTSASPMDDSSCLVGEARRVELEKCMEVMSQCTVYQYKQKR